MKTERLTDICDVRIGRTPDRDKPVFWNGNHQWASIFDLKAKTIERTRERITDRAVVECRPTRVEPGTLLLSFKLSLGKVAIAGVPLYTNEAIAALPFRKPADSDPYYFYYLLQTIDWGSYGRRAVKGNCLNKDILEAVEIRYPELPEQKRIAALLEKTDRLRRMRHYARQLSDTFLQSVFVERFGKDESCDRRTIQALLDQGAIKKIEDGNHGEIHPRATDFVKEGIPFLTATNVIDDQVMLERAPRISVVKAAQLRIGWIQSDDVLLSHNATVGRVAVAPQFKDKVVIGTSLTFYRLNQNEFTSEYFAEALRARSFQAQLEKAMEQTTRNQVPVSRQKELLIPVRAFPLQQEFADIVRRFERLRTQQREAERQAEHLFQTLLHRAFTPV